MWKVTSVVVSAIAAGHAYSATFEGIPTETTSGELCPADTACNDNRECAFGTLATYDIVRNAVFEVTGYSAGCIGRCSCTPSASSRVGALLAQAESDPAIYNNNSICSNAVIIAGMNFITANYPCDGVFAEAQVPLFRLCGTTPQGAKCAGRCTSQYEISVPLPACRQREGPRVAANVVVGLMVCLLALLWAKVPGSIDSLLAVRPTPPRPRAGVSTLFK